MYDAIVQAKKQEKLRRKALEDQARRMGLRSEQRRLMRLAARFTKYSGPYAEHNAAVFVQRLWRTFLDREAAWADALYG